MTFENLMREKDVLYNFMDINHYLKLSVGWLVELGSYVVKEEQHQPKNCLKFSNYLSCLHGRIF